MVFYRDEDKSFDWDHNEFAKENDEINFNTKGKDYIAVDTILSALERDKISDEGNREEELTEELEYEKPKINELLVRESKEIKLKEPEIDLQNAEELKTGSLMEPESTSEQDFSVEQKLIGWGNDMPAPPPPELDLKKIKKSFNKAKETYRVPMPPAMDSVILKKVKQEIEDEKNEHKKIPVPPPISLKKIKLVNEKLIEKRTQAPPQAPILNYKTLRNAKQNVNEHLEDTRHQAEEEHWNEEEIRRKLRIKEEEAERMREEEEEERKEKEDKIIKHSEIFEEQQKQKKEAHPIMKQDELQKL